MSGNATSARLTVWFCAALAASALAPARAAEPPLKLEALLIWGTNDPRSPDPKHKPVSPQLRKKLEGLPFKWTNYFVVNRQEVHVPPQALARVAMSEKCDLEIRNLGNSTVQVSLFGKREHILKRTQALPKGETLVLGGNAPNATSWLVVLKQVEPAAPDAPQPGK